MPSVSDLYQLHAWASAKSLRYYLDNVVINSSPKPKAWKIIREPWQNDLLAPKLPAFEYLAGLRPTYSGPLSFFDVLARGHDKSSLEGRLATGLLLCSQRPIQGYIVAADKDQGKLLTAAMVEEATLNPWVMDQLTFSGDTVSGPNGVIEVVPADAGGAYGYRGNLFIFDELTNWNKPVCKKVYEGVMSGTEKRDPRVVAIISNAGFHGSWQEDVWKEAQKQTREWSTFYRKGQLATWMKKERVDNLRKLLSPSEARRVFDNDWINPGEDNGYLTVEECLKCIDPMLSIRLRGVGGIRYFASIDYGPKRDRTCLMVGHMDASGRCFIDRCDVYEGKNESSGTVQIGKVRRWILDVWEHFDIEEFVIDPAAGMLSEIAWLDENHIPTHPYAPRGGKGNLEIANTLRSMITGNAVRWYEGCGDVAGSSFVEELSRLVTVQKNYGYRIDHTASEHDDRAVTLGQLLVRLSQCGS